MQEIQYFTCIYHSVLFFCCKRSQLIRLVRFYALLNNEDSQQDRVTKYWHWSFTDFMKIYRKCTSEPYSFLTIDTTLPADNPLRFRKNLLNPLWKWY